jgi:hypothetical protein
MKTFQKLNAENETKELRNKFLAIKVITIFISVIQLNGK